jgi:hypothetical protein
MHKLAFFSLLVALCLPGCGQKAPQQVPVKGKVIFADRKSLDGATIRFWPQDAKISQSPSASCSGDGTFSLDCPPGSYKVTVTPRPPVGKAAAPPPQAAAAGIPSKYRDSIQTPLRVTVTEEDAEEKVLKLQ